MACPICGGTAREPIAPGYWRCTSTVTTSAPGPGAPGRPWTGPETSVFTGVCGATYQEGPAANNDLVCGCGTFAIGLCQRCGVPVCGNHSTDRFGVRECLNRVQDRQREAAEQRAEQERQAAAQEAEAKQQEADARAAALAHIKQMVGAMNSRKNPGTVKIINYTPAQARGRADATAIRSSGAAGSSAMSRSTNLPATSGLLPAPRPSPRWSSPPRETGSLFPHGVRRAACAGAPRRGSSARCACQG